MAVDETIDSLGLFLKHYKPEPQDAVHVDNIDVERKAAHADGARLTMAAFKLGHANFEFQVKASGLEAKLPVSAEDIKTMRLFHMFVFGEVQIAMTFGDQMIRQVEMLQKLIERSSDSVFPVGFVPRVVTYKELAGILDTMLAS